MKIHCVHVGGKGVKSIKPTRTKGVVEKKYQLTLSKQN